MNDSQRCGYGAGPPEHGACICTMVEINNLTPLIWIIEELTGACKPRKKCVCAYLCVCVRPRVVSDFFFVGSLLICWCMCLFGSYLNVTASHSANLSFSLPLSVVFLFSIHRSWFLLSFFYYWYICSWAYIRLLAFNGKFWTGWGSVCVCVFVWSNCWTALGSACRQERQSVQ